MAEIGVSQLLFLKRRRHFFFKERIIPSVHILLQLQTSQNDKKAPPQISNMNMQNIIRPIS